MQLSNSALVCYTKLSPNYTRGRNHSIDTITIHCMAGNLTIERCADIFANKNRKASSNYGVDSKGRIGLYVEERNRSWCSSNSSNDNRAITIEVANDGGAPNWHVSDKALEALIILLVDICRRNGIKQLIWSNNKTERINHKNGVNMTVHRDYAAKACPGNYLYGKMYWIADQVNKALGVSVPVQVDTKEEDQVYYTIQKGDTLTAIAKKYNTTVLKLQELNPSKIKNINMISAGMQIRVK